MLPTELPTASWGNYGNTAELSSTRWGDQAQIYGAFLESTGRWENGKWCLHRAPLERRPDSTLVAGLLAGSGMLTAGSGASAVVLAAGVPAGLDAAALDALARQQETTAWLRQVTGGLGFAAAGLGLIVAGRRQWAAGGALRRVAPASVLLGLAMQLVWLDAATFLHMITGTAFVAWLAAGGGCFLKGRSWWG